MGILSLGLLVLCLVCLWSCYLKSGGLATVFKDGLFMNPPIARLFLIPNSLLDADDPFQNQEPFTLHTEISEPIRITPAS